MPRRAVPPHRALIAASLLGLGLAACDFLDMLRILTVDFGFERLDVSQLAFERDPLLAARDLVDFDVTARKKYGVDVRCRIRARNPNAHPAAFDGAAAFLRVQDTAASATAAQAQIPAFRVGARGDTVFDIVFPLRMDQPVFSQDVWTKIFQGSDIPYRLDADFFFKVLDEAHPAAPFGSSRVRLNVAKGSVDARETSAALIQALLEYLDLIF